MSGPAFLLSTLLSPVCAKKAFQSCPGCGSQQKEAEAVTAFKEKAESHDSSPDRSSEWAWVLLTSRASSGTAARALQHLGEAHRDSQARAHSRNQRLVSRNVSGDNPQATLVFTVRLPGHVQCDSISPRDPPAVLVLEFLSFYIRTHGKTSL